ncbi:MAG TPA: DnaJ family domain-containing protein [Candidatus Limnocylindria bacterium]|nr:DnaJ family domain-containing protein [Candidatus Limnocylindria bacterium]
MFLLETMAENKIREAMARGEFANLPGAGKPLRLEDDSTIPDDLRIAYKILRNAGCIPPELEVRKEIITLRDLLRTIEGEGAKKDKIRELNYKLMKLSIMSRRMVTLDEFPEYKERILGKMSAGNPG